MPSQREFRDADEGPQESDLQRFGGETRPCPKCGAEIYDEAEWCHKCGHVLSETTDHKVPAWVIAGAIALSVAIAMLIIFR